MKKLMLASIVVLVALHADWMRIAGLSDNPLPPNIYVLKSDTAGITLAANIFGFTKKDTIIDDKTFQRVEIPEQYKYHDSLYKGKPQIPYIRLLIAVPDSCGFNITVLPGEATTFNQYLIYPVPRVAFGDSDGLVYFHEVYTYDTAFYNKDTLYPNMFYTVNSTGHWRDQRVIELFLYPVQHNPQKQTMDFYTNLYVQINYTGSKYANENGLGPFEDIGRDILINYPGIERQPNPHPNPAVHYYTNLINPTNDADYIIVTHDMFIFNETTSRWISDFAQWRVDHNNFDVGIITVQEIYEEFPPGPTYDSVASLHDFLVYAYENWQAHVSPDGHFGYCLFIGDWDFVPTETIPYYMPDPNPPYFYRWLGANEYKFADLYEDGTIDIMLGRWPVKGTYDLVAIAQKTLNYEKYPDNTGSWRREGILISGGDWQSQSNETWFDELVSNSKPFFTGIGYDTLCVRWLSYKPDEGVYLRSIHDHLNNGGLIASYYDHGAPDGWFAHYSSHNVKDLINGTRLPVVLSNACLTAMFQWDKPSSTNHPDYEPDTSMGEHFLINPNGGAVAFFGATAYSEMPNAYRMLEYLFYNQYWILGKFLLPGLYGLGGPNGELHCYCLLGDPALDLGDYTAVPDKPDILVRPLGLDIKVQPPYPYPTSGDVIPVQVLIWNIGAATAYDVQVELDIEFPPTTVIGTTIIPQILPRDTALATIYWNTGITYPGYYGELGNAKFIIKADPADIIDESWELNNQSSVTGRVALYPNQSGWPKRVSRFSQPALGNIDGTGAVEIIYHSAESIYVYRPDGTQAPGWPQQFSGVHGLVVGDINNDNFLEIVAVSCDYVKAFNYQGSLLWSQQVPPGYPYHDFEGFPSLGHIQGLATLDVVVFMKYKHETQIGRPKIMVYDCDGIFYGGYDASRQCLNSNCKGLAISDVNSDGMQEIVVSYFYGGLPVSYQLDIFNRTGRIDARGYGGNTVPALADLTGDAAADVIVGCNDNYIRAYNARQVQELWARETEGPINSSPAVGDIYPAPYVGVEITFGNDASKTHLRHGPTGDNIWQYWPYTITPSTWVQTSPAIANINGDRHLDIIIGANNQYIYAFKHTRDLIAPFPLPLFGCDHSAPLIGDIDGDRKSEIVLASDDGYLHVWKNLDSKVPIWSLSWPQFHHDYQRTGLYGWVDGLLGGDANPVEFSAATTISLTLEKNSHSKVNIYDSEGNLVRTLVDQILQSGTHHPVWDGKDDNYSFLPNGQYFIEIKVKGDSKIIPVQINR